VRAGEGHVFVFRFRAPIRAIRGDTGTQGESQIRTGVLCEKRRYDPDGPELTSLQGVSQNEDARYDFFIVEVTGSQTVAQVRLHDGAGVQIATRAYTLRPYEQLLVNMTDLAPGARVTGGRIDATVLSETGRVIVAGSLVASGSQDSTGFEMSFRSDLLATNSASGAPKSFRS